MVLCMNPPSTPPQEDRRANAVLLHLCRSLGVSDIELAEAVGMKRQVMYTRRTGLTALKFDEVHAIAGALEVPMELFLGEPIDAVRWVLANRPETFEVAA